jgi:hypothetical protein
MTTFIHGEIFADTQDGMSAIAAVEVDGTNLTLRRLVILANPPGRVGLTSLRRWLRKVGEQAKGQGFQRLSLEFDRVTGANPRRHRVIVVDLSP